MKKLETRHQTERDFHDKLAQKIRLSNINYLSLFESATAPETKFAFSQMGKIRGKKILDLGCGTGEASLYFAKKGAKVYAIDISPGMVEILKSMVKRLGLSKMVFPQVMLAEKLKYRDNYFDVVYGRGVIHHVSVDPALKEVFRVLKPAGVATFVEPLEHNPAINIYRKIAKDVRTPDETPLNYGKINKLTNARYRKLFHKEFQLCTLLIFLWYFLVERVNPNKERYWDKLIEESKKKERVFNFLKTIDDIIFNTLPFLRKYAWYTVLVYTK